MSTSLAAALLLLLLSATTIIRPVAAQEQPALDSTPATANTNNGNTTMEVEIIGRQFNISQRFEMVFTLDGPTGDGNIRTREQNQTFQFFNAINITALFVPDFAQQEHINEVLAVCVFRSQRSGELPEADLLGNTTYTYTYDVYYSSPTVSVEDYPLYYTQAVYQNTALMTTSLFALLNVPPTNYLTGSNLTFDGVYPIARNATATSTTTVTVTLPTAPTTAAPSISYSPSIAPSLSPAPTVSSAPSFFPTFEKNDTARGRFDWTFMVHKMTNPEDRFLNSAKFCDLMVALTPSIVPPGQNASQVKTTCPYVSRGFTIIGRTLAPLPSTELTFPPVDGGSPVYYDYDDDSWNTTMAPDEDGNDMSEEIARDEVGVDDGISNTTTERRFLRGLQEDEVIVNVGNVSANFTGNFSDKVNVRWVVSVVMRYESAVWDVSDYPKRLEELINRNMTAASVYLEGQYGLTPDANVTVLSFDLINERTFAPSFSPTGAPSLDPTPFFSLEPVEPTAAPSTNSSTDNVLPTPGLPPGGNTTNSTDSPSMMPTEAPTPTPPPPSVDDNTVIIAVSVLVSVFVALIMLALFILYSQRKSQLRREAMLQDRLTEAISLPSERTTAYVNKTTNETFVSTLSEPHDMSMRKVSSRGSVDIDEALAKPAPAEEPKNKASRVASYGAADKKEALRASGLLSDIAENVYDDDDDENGLDGSYPTEDDTASQSPPRDEFEQYKDQNLEKMRSRVENNVQGLDDMMSRAMTVALMADESSAPSWHGATTGIEIEANALWDVTDWMRRQGSAPEDDRQEYMQYLLTKMVTSVRMGMMGPDDASRTIHECAALLELELANALPVGTLILTGMQKTTTPHDVIRSFKKFGPIQDAAVASNQKGFGLLRFKNQNGATASMQRFRSSEIVVKDVAITLRSLGPLLGSGQR